MNKRNPRTPKCGHVRFSTSLPYLSHTTCFQRHFAEDNFPSNPPAYLLLWLISRNLTNLCGNWPLQNGFWKNFMWDKLKHLCEINRVKLTLTRGTRNNYWGLDLLLGSNDLFNFQKDMIYVCTTQHVWLKSLLLKFLLETWRFLQSFSRLDNSCKFSPIIFYASNMELRLSEFRTRT